MMFAGVSPLESEHLHGGMSRVIDMSVSMVLDLGTSRLFRI
jgi:hypothetical protein